MSQKSYRENLYFIICLFIAIILHFFLLYFTKYEIPYKRSMPQDNAIRIIKITPKMVVLPHQEVETLPKSKKVVISKEIHRKPIIEEPPKDVIITERKENIGMEPEHVFVSEEERMYKIMDKTYSEGGTSTDYLPSYSVSRPPKIIKLFKPEYPKLARARGLEGVVVLEVDIDAKGFVKEVRVVKSLGFGFDEEAVKAIKRSHFLPAEQFGNPIPVRVRIPIRFKLED